MKEINLLVEKLLKAKEAYYNSQPIMSDSEFDSLEDELYRLDPENYYFSIVGISIKGSNKIKHSVPMLSCGKAKTSEDIFTWLKRIKCEDEVLLEMPKIDGLSGTIKYNNGKISYIATRGDGSIGQDITYLKDYLNIPQNIPILDSYEVRGEIYLPKNTKFNVDGKPLRNVASGLVGRKDQREDCKYLKFIAYQAIGTSKTKCNEVLDEIRHFGFDVVEYTLLKKEEVEKSRLHYLSVKRQEWLYETDGLVLTINDMKKYEDIDSLYKVDHHHHYNIALKPPAAGQKTILREIEWNVSKNGYLIPVAIFDPIFFDGRKVQRASLSNYGNVVNNSLKENDEIFITLANDVIPFFNEKIKDNEGKSLIIDKCVCCGSKLVIESNNVTNSSDIVLHARCINKKCKDQIIKTILSYCIECEMDGISIATIQTLYEHNLLTSIIDLYSLKDHHDEILRINGFGENKVDNLLDQIEKSKKMNVIQFFSRIGIENVGEKSLINLGIKSIQDFWNLNQSDYVIGKTIIQFKKENKDFIDKMIEIIHPTDIVIKNSLGKVCMTGSGPKSRKELIKLIEEKGYEFVDSVNKETNILLCEDPSGNSSKLEKARKLGVTLMNYDEFFNSK